MDLISIVGLVLVWLFTAYMIVLKVLQKLRAIRIWFESKKASRRPRTRSHGKNPPVQRRRVNIVVNRRDV